MFIRPEDDLRFIRRTIFGDANKRVTSIIQYTDCIMVVVFRLSRREKQYYYLITRSCYCRWRVGADRQSIINIVVGRVSYCNRRPRRWRWQQVLAYGFVYNINEKSRGSRSSRLIYKKIKMIIIINCVPNVFVFRHRYVILLLIRPI